MSQISALERSEYRDLFLGERSSRILPGQYFDAETGLSYNHFRDYDPSIARYVKSDPIGLYGGVNTFAYVGSSPLGKSDPDGLVAVPLGAPLLGACGPVCWSTVAIVGAAVLIISKCTNDEGSKPSVSNDRVEKCKKAFQRCLADETIRQEMCFHAYDECIKHNETFIFPGAGNRGNPVN